MVKKLITTGLSAAMMFLIVMPTLEYFPSIKANLNVIVLKNNDVTVSANSGNNIQSVYTDSKAKAKSKSFLGLSNIEANSTGNTNGTQTLVTGEANATSKQVNVGNNLNLGFDCINCSPSYINTNVAYLKGNDVSVGTNTGSNSQFIDTELQAKAKSNAFDRSSTSVNSTGNTNGTQTLVTGKTSSSGQQWNVYNANIDWFSLNH